MKVRLKFVLLIMLLFPYITTGAQAHGQESSEPPSKCVNLGYGEIYLGDGTLYCQTTVINSCNGFGYCTNMTPVSIMVGENQHFLEHTENLTDGNSEPESQRKETRWEEVGRHVVYGVITTGGDEGFGSNKYNCSLMMPATNLPDDWGLSDLEPNDEIQLPSWCGMPASDSDRNYTDGAHPYDGIWMIEADQYPNHKIVAHRIVGPFVERLEWTAESAMPDPKPHEHGGSGADNYIQNILGSDLAWAPLIGLLFTLGLVAAYSISKRKMI